MRIATSILSVVKPIVLSGEITHAKFTSNNGMISMTTVDKKLKVQTYTLKIYDNVEKAAKVTRALNKVYRF